MTCPRDDFYTPTELADKLASLVVEDGIKSVIDFCVGDGDLLKAVKNRIPTVECYGTDIEVETIERLRKSQKDWTLNVCDFTNTEWFDCLRGLGDRKYDLIVLNPPFTCKGSTVCRTTFEGVDYSISTAMLFVTNALKYRADNGVLYAILPSSCAYSQKDGKLWAYLREKYNLQVLEIPERMYWNNCSASIILVSVGGKIKRETHEMLSFDFSSLPIERIVRGHISPHEANYVEGRKGVKFIHTTNLQNNCVVNCSRICLDKSRDIDRYGSVAFSGPAVLIPRVCNPNQGKVCLYKEKAMFVPSDCVIALCTKSVNDAMIIVDTICEQWLQFRTIYQGTAAKYTTMERVLNLFGKVPMKKM